MGNKSLAADLRCRCAPHSSTSPTSGILSRGAQEGGPNPFLLDSYLDDSPDILPPSVHAACLQAAIHSGAAGVERVLERGVNANVRWYEKAEKGKPPSGTGLHLATALDDQATILLLLKNSADINMKNYYGESPLHVAASTSSSNTLVLLLEDKNLKCVNDTSKRRRRENDERLFVGCTALEMAAGYRRAAAVEILLRYGAKIGRAVDTCCALANKDDDADLMKLLLSQGLSINAHRGAKKNTLLHEAAEKGNPKIVSALLEAGAKVNSRNHSRTTPLIYAICQQQVLVIERLLRGGADVNMADTRHYTPLHCAALYGQVRVIEMLLIHGARLSATDRRYQLMPHHLCITSSHCNQLALHVMLLHEAPLEASSSLGPALKLAWEENQGSMQPYLALLVSHGACDEYILTQLGHVYVTGKDYSWLPDILRLVIYSGNQNGNLDHQLDAIQSWFFAVDHKYYHWLVDFRKDPLSLKLQCRVVIRKLLRQPAKGLSIWKAIKQTSLPWVLQDYLKLSDLYDLEATLKQSQIHRPSKEDTSVVDFQFFGQLPW